MVENDKKADPPPQEKSTLQTLKASEGQFSSERLPEDRPLVVHVFSSSNSQEGWADAP